MAATWPPLGNRRPAVMLNPRSESALGGMASCLEKWLFQPGTLPDFDCDKRSGRGAIRYSSASLPRGDISYVSGSISKAGFAV
jgi:hypothetical protein